MFLLYMTTTRARCLNFSAMFTNVFAYYSVQKNTRKKSVEADKETKVIVVNILFL